MSAIANITVYDGAATPVAHTLSPISVTRENGLVRAEWREGLTGIPVYAQVRCTMQLQKLKSGVYRVEQRVVVPVMESVSGQNAAGYTAAPKVAYENTVVMIGFFHERSDAAGRRLVRQTAINIGGNISTSVAAATTGPLPELFDLLVAPT
nr:MAG: hypothetical protein 2 [Leviviridae sp.]